MIISNQIAGAFPRHVLLVEPYPELRDVLYELLVEAGCQVDVAMTGYEMGVAIAATRYDCVLLNIDQNRALDFGLELASVASAAGARIIMIPDYEVDRASIAAKGWLQLTKPFSVADVLSVLALAEGPAGETSAIAQRADDEAANKSIREAKQSEKNAAPDVGRGAERQSSSKCLSGAHRGVMTGKGRSGRALRNGERDVSD